MRHSIANILAWTGLGCDVCGFGTVEDVDAYRPELPCPDCGHLQNDGLIQRVAKAKYKKKKKVKSKDGDELVVYEYGPRQISNRNKEKAERVEKLRKKIDQLRKKVMSDLDNPAALAIALMDETFERVGNDDSAEEGHFGVTGWKPEHIKFTKNKAIISYVGKSGVKQRKEVTTPALVKALRKACDGDEECESVIQASAEDVNEYLKPFGVTAKDLRGFHANREMQDRLKKIRKDGPELPFSRKDKDKILKKEFKKALEETAKEVGHEPSTLRSQYLVPGLEDDYMHDGTVKDELVKKAGRKPKSEEEREQDQAESMIRKSPKYKPPRQDLRNNRRIQERDKDLEGLDKQDGGDKDLQRDVRRMKAAMISYAFLDELVSRVAAKKDRKPGEVWRNDRGRWVGKNKDGVSHTFDDKKRAEQYAKGDIDESDLEDEEDDELDELDFDLDGDGELEEDEKDEWEAEKEREGKNRAALKTIEKTLSRLSKNTKLSRDDRDFLEIFLEEASDEDRAALIEGFTESIDALVEMDFSSPEAQKTARQALANKDLATKDPKKLAKQLAELTYASNVVANPTLLLSETDLDDTKLEELANNAFAHYSKLNTQLRTQAAKQIEEMLEGLGEDSNRRAQLEEILGAMNIAEIADSGKNLEGQPDVTKGMANLIKNMVKKGQSAVLFKSDGTFFEPEVQKALLGSLLELDTIEVLDLMIGDAEDHPWSEFRKLFDPSNEEYLPHPFDQGLRDYIIQTHIMEVSWYDRALRDALAETYSSQDVENTPEARQETISKFRAEANAKLLERYNDCIKSVHEALAKGEDPGKDETECQKELSAKQSKLANEDAGAFLAFIEQEGLAAPNSSAVVVLREFAETGDRDLLTTTTKPSPDEHSGNQQRRQKSAYGSHFSAYNGSLVSVGPCPDTVIARFGRRELSMSKITKKGALQVTADLDRIANLFQFEYRTLGIPEKLAFDTAKRLDAISSQIELTASVGKTAAMDPASNYTLTDLAPGNFNPAEIGEEQSAPPLRNEDEPYMDTFRQEWFDELRQVQQTGQFSNAKVAKQILAALTRFATAGQKKNEVRFSVLDRLASDLAIHTELLDAKVAAFELEAGVGRYTDVQFEKAVKKLVEMESMLADMNAQIESLLPGLLARQESLEKELKNGLTALKKELPVTIKGQQATVLEIRDAIVRFHKVAERKLPGANQIIQEDNSGFDIDPKERGGALVQRIAAELGQEVAEKVETIYRTVVEEITHLQPTVRYLKLELATKEASVQKQAGVMSALLKLRDFFVKNFKKVISLFGFGDKRIEGAKKDIMSSIADAEKQLNAIKVASDCEADEEVEVEEEEVSAGKKAHGYDLFAE
jgi:DNA topoisomerase-1